MLLLAACVTPDVPPAPSLDTGEAPEHTVLVGPYLQSVEPTRAWISWETLDGEGSVVEYGETEALGETATGDALVGGHGVQHEVLLEDLEPDTSYWYAARTGATRSTPTRFRTPPEAGVRTRFQLVASSDMQRDDAWPEKWADVVRDGIVPYLTDTYAPELPEAAGMLLLAGDLVDNGWIYTDWTEDFFPGAAPIMGQVPLWPVLGNHEGNTPAYFQYFHLPENGTPGFEEHWWTTDYATVRVIGLDSNTGYTLPEQLDWLDEVLARTCTDDTIEFVFAELHHPYLSELWPSGELDYTGDVITKMEAFTTACGKPSIHFFGHTHGYSRGASLDHRHLWVNVGAGGGALDRWGTDGQANYDQFSNSQDDYGFVVVEVEPGAFTLKRISLGTPEAPTEPIERDRITLTLAATPPNTPVITTTLRGTTVTLAGSPFAHAASGEHGASQWQVSADCAGYTSPVVDRWIQHEDWYQGVDQRADIDLTTVDAGALSAGAWCARVRYRDRGLAWSEWSENVHIAVE
jgi:hypothetical protein